jgi:hypothetical protein
MQPAQSDKLATTALALSGAWGLFWSLGYLWLAANKEGPGDASSWLLVLLFAWGPTGVFLAGRAWWGWFRAPDQPQ